MSTKEATLKKIEILEQRLAQAKNSETSNDDLKGLFSDQGVCLYYYLLGDSYLALHSLSMSKIVNGVDASERCLQAFESGVSNSANSLEIVDRKNNRPHQPNSLSPVLKVFPFDFVLYSTSTFMHLFVVQCIDQTEKQSSKSKTTC